MVILVTWALFSLLLGLRTELSLWSESGVIQLLQSKQGVARGVTLAVNVFLRAQRLYVYSQFICSGSV